MTIYKIKGKGYRFEFQVNKKEYSSKFFEKKKDAIEAETKLKKEVKKAAKNTNTTTTDITFYELLQLRLDYLKAKGPEREKYYNDNRYMGKRWVKEWKDLPCTQITAIMIQKFLNKRKDEYIKECERLKKEPKSFHYALNTDIRCLKATFNYGIRMNLLEKNPVNGTPLFPVNKTRRYSPPYEDILKIISITDKDTQDYLNILKDTLARVNEINRLTWDDVDFKERTITLRTRKKKGGIETPRLIPMSKTVRRILKRRHRRSPDDMPFVFFHEYYSALDKDYVLGPYKDRKRFMKTLCKEAGVKYFRFHGIRHSAASYLNNQGVPLSAIQRLLGHEKLTTTQIYLHDSPESLRDAIKFLGG